jgi:small subunit ribosomal protein S8
MSMTDPIADMLTRIRNASQRKYDTVNVPASHLKLEIARILKDEGYIEGFEMDQEAMHPTILIHLKYTGRNQPVINGLMRKSRPGLRVYVGKDAIPRVKGGMGTAILSTSRGVMTGRDSKGEKIGGEVLCYIW